MGHLYYISDSFDTLTEASFDFHEKGSEIIDKVEIQLAEMCADVHDEPYNMNVANGDDSTAEDKGSDE